MPTIKGFLPVELGQYHEAIKEFHTALNLKLDGTESVEFKFSS